MDLRDAITLHQLTLQAEGRSAVTMTNYVMYQRFFLEFLQEHEIEPTLEALNPLNVRTALGWYRDRAERRGKRNGETAPRQFAQRLKTFARFLETEMVIPKGTLDRISAPRVPKHLRSPLTVDELSRMWNACRLSRNRLRDEALLLLLIDTGMRIGEAATLTLDKLQLDQRRVIVGLGGKGRRERIVPLGNPAETDGGRTIRALSVYLASRPPESSPEVFVRRDGCAISPDAASVAIQRLGKDAGVADPIPHRIRHAYATQYLTKYPGDEHGLRRIIGHASTDVLSDYVHLSESAIAGRNGGLALTKSLESPVESDGEQPLGPELRRIPRFCTSCGYPRSAEHRFCAGCGCAVDDNALSVSPT